MAVINLNLGEIVEDCPNLLISDNTDYSLSGTFVFSTFKFHDYLSGLPGLNGSFTLSDFDFGGFMFSGVDIVIETDGDGNIINAETQYNALTDALMSAADTDISVDFVKPNGTGYRDWYIQISSSNIVSYSGGSTSVTVSGGVLSPTYSGISVETSPVSSRNLTILDKDGTVLDLGAVAQLDTLSLSGSYSIGESFNISFCGESISYAVEVGETSAECVAQGIYNQLSTLTGGLFEKYVSFSRKDGVISFEAKEAGVPFNLSVSYTGIEDFVFNTDVSNVSTMLVPSYTSSNDVVYEMMERGGEYTAILTVVSDCDYNTQERCVLSWCYDLSQFDCCFVEAVKGSKEGCCNSKDGSFNASVLRNIIMTIPKVLEKGESESNIQKIINMGWSICDDSGCGCPNC